jgi:hypothetical protein
MIKLFEKCIGNSKFIHICGRCRTVHTHTHTHIYILDSMLFDTRFVPLVQRKVHIPVAYTQPTFDFHEGGKSLTVTEK